MLIDEDTLTLDEWSYPELLADILTISVSMENSEMTTHPEPM